MLLTLDLRWTGDLLDYNLQVGSIIQVIGYKGEGGRSEDVNEQFKWYATSSTTNGAAPYDSTDLSHKPDSQDVYLANYTQTGHEILYTGSIQNLGDFYGLYTQITVDSYLYDHVYIRVFGATSIGEGEVTASYWGVSDPQSVTPSYATATYATNNFSAVTNANYFEVIPEPATLGLLGVGGIALAAWRRRRFARTAGDEPEREED